MAENRNTDELSTVELTLATNGESATVICNNVPADKDESARALRTSTALSVFYLIMTDVLGPTSAPFAMSQLGFITGAVLFVVFGLAAIYSAKLLADLFLVYDSTAEPVRTYADIADRVIGPYARHVVNVMQSVQLIVNVALVIIGNAQAVSQIANGGVCFLVVTAAWSVAGILVGQIKSLSNFGLIANASIWMNGAVVVITAVAVSLSPPNVIGAFHQNGVSAGPVVTALYSDLPLTSQLVGVMTIVYAFGGAMMFIELMAEMKQPKRFMRAMVSAEAIIIVLYLVFALYVYAVQGQFVLNPANQGISDFVWQSVTNVVSLLSALIAAGLYGNIGVKVIYQWLVGDAFTPARERVYWSGAVVTYWLAAFVIASAIPQLSNISALISALCIMQFSYTFPPLFILAHTLRREYAFIQAEMPTQAKYVCLYRAAAKNASQNAFHFLLVVISLSVAVLGVYSSIVRIVAGFSQANAATSFGCESPVA